MNVHVSPSANEAARDAALAVARWLVRTDRPTTFGLAGGSTPRKTYWLLRQLDINWNGVTCWLPDERYVPTDHADSNAAMARAELTDHVGAELLVPDTSLASATESAAAYQDELLALLGDSDPGVVMLGMGADGHTASLFPETEALTVEEPGYVANFVPELDTWRLTATTPLLQRSGLLLFLITGTAKADMVQRVIGDAEPYPIREVADGAEGEVVWILDEAAAAYL